MKRIDPWDSIKHYREFNQSEFEICNHGYFENYDAYTAHLVLTSKKLHLIIESPHLAVSIFNFSVAGMNKDLGSLFNSELVLYIDVSGNKIAATIQEYYIGFAFRNKKTISQYFIDKEYAILSLNISLRTTDENKVKYLEDRKSYYLAVSNGGEVINEKDLNSINGYISFCDSYMELLKCYGKELSDIKVNLTEIKVFSFIDDSVSDQFYRIFQKSKIVHLRYYDKLYHFLSYGNLSRTNIKRSKIFFKGDLKTLTYCFYQLMKYKLINRVDNPEKLYSNKEIAKIIFDCFEVGDNLNERSIYDYLRNEKNNRPLNPVFVVKEEKSDKGQKIYNLHKPGLRKKGESIDLEDT